MSEGMNDGTSKDATKSDLSVGSFLSHLGSEISAYRSIMEAGKRQLSPEFNVFDFLEIDFVYENHMSRIIKRLLDPNSVHGQGTSFLGEFFKLIGVNPNDFGQGGYTEFFVPQYEIGRDCGRIDIEIASMDKKFTIWIENKVGTAHDGEKQLTRYNDFLSNNYKSYKLIYLNPKGVYPDKVSMTTDEVDDLIANGKLLILSYQQIINWLIACKGLSQSPRVDNFIVELLNYINRTLLGVKDMTEANIIQNAILEDEKSLETSLRIGVMVEIVKQNLIDRLNQDMISGFKQKLPNCKIIHGFTLRGKWSGISIFRNENSLFGLGFEFENKNANNLFFGVKVRDGNKYSMKHPVRLEWDSKIIKVLEAKYCHSPKQTDWWPSYYLSCDFDKNITNLGSNWESETEMWVKINNGTAVNEFMKAYESIMTTLSEKGFANFFEIEG
ncbi:MAG: PD-(D/E)XK nuclease family protein [Candidatus Pacebacteria bacterium]|nr:PD-(D/E)XK nuclease family protein [Candidatus Paceibacterota bacterium]